MSTIAHHNLNNHDWRMSGMSEYGALVKRAREARGMTQEDVARQMGRPHTFLVRIEKGSNSNPPDPETMRQLWRTLGISMRSQLVSLGYLDPDEPEPGIAYVIREDDPRAALLAALDGQADQHVAAMTEAVVSILNLTWGRNSRNDAGDQMGVA